jgi:aerobic-type carbon monoxide dehydrogenase small subunit (CoxS/CutS family)
MKVRFQLNGESRGIDVEPNDVLLDVLRDKLGMKSPKCGCDRGDCGACSVLLDGKSVRSCLVLAAEMEGSNIVTVEGIGQTDLSSVQKAFLDKNAFQCGYCAPGMIIAATELLEHNKHPNEDEVREALSGNLCRCTGYTPIVEAVCQSHRGKS